MASAASLEALAKTNESLKEILKRVQPFLDILSNDGSDSDANTAQQPDPDRLALAQTALALTLGTLRYMSNRLRGSSEGKNAKDPLRLELNRMRQILVQVQKKQQQQPKTGVTPAAKRKADDNDSNVETTKSPSKEEASAKRFRS